MGDRLVLTEIASTWIDSLILRGNSSYKIFYESFLARLVGLVVFPIFAALDFLGHGCRALGERAWAVLSTDEKSKLEHVQEAWERASLALKCLGGVVGSPIALISPDLITHHFLPELPPKGVENFGKLYSSTCQERQPETIEQVQSIVQEAIRKKRKVGIAGALMSQGKHALPPGQSDFVINTKKLNKVTIDSKKQIARVQAGATWRDVQVEANKHGLALQVMQASNVFSVGGSLSANCHGWDHRAGTLSNTIKSMTIVDAQGQRRVLRPEDRLFKLIAGGYGLFGVIVEVEIELIENTHLREWGEKVPIKDYVAYFRKNVLPSRDIAMHLYRLSLNPKDPLGKGVAVNYSKEKHRSEKVVSKLVDEQEKGTAIDRFFLHVARRRWRLRRTYWALESKRIEHDVDNTRNEVMRASIRGMFNHSKADAEWLQEYFVKGEDLEPFLRKLGKLLKDNDVPLLNATVRYVKQDHDAELGYAKDGDRFAIVLCFTQSLAPEKIEQTRKWVRETIDWPSDHGGTFYLPYAHLASKEQFRKCYPQWKYIVEKKKQYDPRHTFTTGFYNDYFTDEASPCA